MTAQRPALHQSSGLPAATFENVSLIAGNSEISYGQCLAHWPVPTFLLLVLALG